MYVCTYHENKSIIKNTYLLLNTDSLYKTYFLLGVILGNIGKAHAMGKRCSLKNITVDISKNYLRMQSTDC